MEWTSAAVEPAPAGHAAVAGEPTTVLILESSATGAGPVEEARAGAGEDEVRVEWVTCLADALERLGRGGVEVVLVGLGLSDCDGADAFAPLREAAPDTLVLPLSHPGGGSSVTAAAQGEADEPAAAWRAEAGWLPHVLRYVTRRKRVEAVLRIADEALFKEKERARVTLESIGDAVLVTDRRGEVTYLNPAAEVLTGRVRNEALGRPLAEVFDIVDGTTREPAANPALQAIREDRTIGLQANCVLRRRDGSEAGIEDSAAPIHDRHDRVTGAVIVFRDASQSRSMARKMAYLARHDALTGLSNRAQLNERLSQAIRMARRHGTQVALLFVDLDHFKQINDSLGHAIGDHVLQAVARLLTDCVRTTDMVCRQGGDEFVVLLSEIEKPGDAVQVAENLFTALSEPLVVDGHTLHVAISIGISVYPDDGDTAESIIQQADTAMYNARANSNDYGYLSRTCRNDRATARGSVEINLHRAFRQGEFLLHYQPRIDLVTGRINGVEALLRWHDPDHGLVHPEQFVPVAERCGLIVPIGHWVLQEACRQASAWQAAGLPALPVAVNVSAAELRQAHFAEYVAEILRETALEADSLELEVAESALMQDLEASIGTLNELRDMGVRIAIDDFGGGHSSLGHLDRLPVDTLKIDASFLAGLATSPEIGLVLRKIIELGRGLGHRVVAEGVETLHQLAFLHVQGCDCAQGFELGPPMTAGEFARLLAGTRAQAGRLPQAQLETA